MQKAEGSKQREGKGRGQTHRGVTHLFACGTAPNNAAEPATHHQPPEQSTLESVPLSGRKLSGKRGDMQSIKQQARVAGLLYLSLVVTAPFSLIYVPNTLIVRGNATATAHNILASEMLFRAGIVGELIGMVMFSFVVMALYRLLRGVDKPHASLMAILGLMSVPIGFANVLNNVAALILVRGGEFLAVFDRRQLDALAMMFLRLHGQGHGVGEIFWGLWLFPFGVLVFRSGFLPRILGVWLIVNCFAYLAISLTGFLAPQYAAMVSRITFPLLFGELAITLWLVIIGAKEKERPLAATGT
jgi:hypothetical protein